MPNRIGSGPPAITRCAAAQCITGHRELSTLNRLYLRSRLGAGLSQCRSMIQQPLDPQSSKPAASPVKHILMMPSRACGPLTWSQTAHEMGTKILLIS
jgi:hypothetical protein